MEATGVIFQQGNLFLMQKFDTGPPCSKILLTWPRQTDTVFPLADRHTALCHQPSRRQGKLKPTKPVRDKHKFHS